MDFSAISDILIRSCCHTITIDKYLVENNLSERSICHRLAVYLEQNISGFSIDCEYNGDNDSPDHRKHIYYLESECNKIFGQDDETEYVNKESRIYPDIIIHTRGSNKIGDNLLAIEVKKSTNRNRQEIAWDNIKIKSYTSPANENHYNYLFGAIVLFNVGINPSFRITWYQNGEIFENYFLNKT